MADDSSQDKQLPATARKLERARGEGQVARSRDLGHLVAFGVCGLALAATAGPLMQWLRLLVADGLRFDASQVLDPHAMTAQLGALGLRMLLVVVPLGAAMAVAAVIAAVLTGGWNFTWKAMQPRWSKLNPLAGLGRMVSRHQLTEMLKACGLALVLMVVGGAYLQGHLDAFAHLVALPLPTALGEAGALLGAGLALLLLTLAAFALVDVPLQRWLLRDKLKMSHQEVKQEHKETEGNTEVKGKMRARMRSLGQRRMLAAVLESDIVVMNPTHYAVALKYDEAGGGAPRLVAKGADLMALRIRDAAQGARVPVLQAPPLARALYAHCELDQEIPAALFAAVAQVLAWVFQLRGALAAGTPLPDAPAALGVPPELDPALGPPQRRRGAAA
ncbi:MAG: flagellar type III secretion system protein FlhB [Rubrivivax sp.]